MTEQTVSGPARQGARRLGRRGALAAGLSVALVGGGVAFAATQLWSDEETSATANMGIECTTVFGETQGAVAPTLTGDPVADCARVRAEAGLDPIADPVAFIVDGAMYVTPEDQVPEGADLLEIDLAAAAAIRELQASLRDVVDGGAAQCLTPSDAVPFVEGELARLGITGWSVRVADRGDEADALPCALVEIDADPRTVAIYPGMEPPTEEWMPAEILEPLRGIGAQCLTVDEAYAVGEAALGAQEHFPTTRVVDEGVACARVDLEVGGSYLLTVYGPTSVG